LIEEVEQAEKEALASRDTKMPVPETVTQGIYAEPDVAMPGKS
jgi:hypothetical protein